MNRMLRQLDPYIIDTGCLNEQNDFFPPGYEFFLRTARFYEFQFITGGRAVEKTGGGAGKIAGGAEKTGGGKLIIDGRHYETRKGDLFFIKPGMQVRGIAGFYAYNVAFDPVYSEAREYCYHSDIPFWASDGQTMLRDGDFFDDLPYQFHTAKFEEFETLFAGIRQWFLRDPQANQPHMKELLLQIINLIYGELDSNSSPGINNADQYYEKVMNSKLFIDNNLGKKLNLEGLARQFGTSPAFFLKIFKKIMGITPFEYIIESRLTQARKLLATASLSIEEVASCCGFEDISYFYRLFKQRFDITPALFSEGYRNRGRTGEAMESMAENVAGAPPVEGAPKEGTPPRKRDLAPAITINNPEPLPVDPYIIGCTFDNQTNYVFPVGVKMVPRVARYYEIELILGGAGKEIIEGLHFNASRGDIFFRRPGMFIQSISGHYFCEIAFDPVFSEGRRKFYESPTPFFLSEPETILPDQGLLAQFPYKYHTARLAELEPLFTSICRSYLERKENWRLEANANLLKILTIMTEELSVHPPIIFENQAFYNKYDRVMALKSFIDQHPEYKFSLDSLADMCGVSRNFFYKIFKQVMGTSPFEYINEARLRLAKTLLATSHLSIEEISACCGFDNPTYFYRVFKRHMKMTPNTFRQKSNLLAER